MQKPTPRNSFQCVGAPGAAGMGGGRRSVWQSHWVQARERRGISDLQCGTGTRVLGVISSSDVHGWAQIWGSKGWLCRDSRHSHLQHRAAKAEP